jgi:hypothetical protein
MGKQARIFSSIAVAIVLLSASPASAQQGTPVYNTDYYSDASYTEQVGAIFWVGCDHQGLPYYQQSGTITAYPNEYLVGYCYEDR